MGPPGSDTRTGDRRDRPTWARRRPGIAHHRQPPGRPRPPAKLPQLRGAHRRHLRTRSHSAKIEEPRAHRWPPFGPSLGSAPARHRHHLRWRPYHRPSGPALDRRSAGTPSSGHGEPRLRPGPHGRGGTAVAPPATRPEAPGVAAPTKEAAARSTRSPTTALATDRRNQTMTGPASGLHLGRRRGIRGFLRSSPACARGAA